MTTPMTIPTDRLILRPPAPSDLPALTAFYMSERSRLTGGHVPRTQAWLKSVAMLGHWTARGYGLWAVTAKEDGAFLGLVGPFYPDGWPEHELGWILMPEAEGRGIAFEAATAARAHARATLGWDQIVSYINAANIRSIALAERLGAVLDQSAAQPNPDAPCHVYRHPVAA